MLGNFYFVPLAPQEFFSIAPPMDANLLQMEVLLCTGELLALRTYTQGRNLTRSGARGGLGGYSPRRSMLAPSRKVKSDFSEIFGIYSTLKTIFSPSSEASAPVGKFLAPPLSLTKFEGCQRLPCDIFCL